MDALQVLLALALLLLPSPLLAAIERLRAKKVPPILPASDEEGARRAYAAFVRAQVEPADPYPAYEQLPGKTQGIWRQVARAAYGLPLLLCLLLSGACGTVHRTPRHDLADAIDGNAADLAAFGRWDDERQLKIRRRCEEQRCGETEFRRRLTGYRETRDALRVLLKRQVHTLSEAVKLLGDSPEGRL